MDDAQAGMACSDGGLDESVDRVASPIELDAMKVQVRLDRESTVTQAFEVETADRIRRVFDVLATEFDVDAPAAAKLLEDLQRVGFVVAGEDFDGPSQRRRRVAGGEETDVPIACSNSCSSDRSEALRLSLPEICSRGLRVTGFDNRMRPCLTRSSRIEKGRCI